MSQPCREKFFHFSYFCSFPRPPQITLPGNFHDFSVCRQLGSPVTICIQDFNCNGPEIPLSKHRPKARQKLRQAGGGLKASRGLRGRTAPTLTGARRLCQLVTQNPHLSNGSACLFNQLIRRYLRKGQDNDKREKQGSGGEEETKGQIWDLGKITEVVQAKKWKNVFYPLLWPASDAPDQNFSRDVVNFLQVRHRDTGVDDWLRSFHCEQLDGQVESNLSMGRCTGPDD